ncbi:MAG: TerC family protein [Rhizobacter sp.]|nr:TerC family protein [Chlorobiales bacterium]
MFEEPLWMWGAFLVFIAAMLALDLGVFNKESHRVTSKEAAIWSSVWISLAMVFSGIVYLMYGQTKATEFLTGFLIEKSLSVDNLFVFVLIFTYFKVPDLYQHRVLFWGVIGAIVMRAIFIFAGVALMHQFHWIIYIFGGFLIYTGIKLFFNKEEADADFAENWGVRIAKKLFKVTDRYDGDKFFTVENAKRVATPMFLVLVVIEVSDLIFAVDSIPAIFAVTDDVFILFTSNIFAIMGLRSLYFLLANVMDKFIYLKTGLAVILTFVGVKMCLADTPYKIPSEISLVVVLGVLILSIVASLLLPKEVKAKLEHTAEEMQHRAEEKPVESKV